MSERPDPVQAAGYPPSDDVLSEWHADWRTIPKDQWDLARRAGWIGPLAGWLKPLAPHPAPSKQDVARQNVIEYEFDKNGFDLGGKSWILDRPGSSSTYLAFRLGCDGTLLPGHPMPWDQRGALCIVRLGEFKQGEATRYTCAIQVWNIWNDRLSEHGWSVIPFDEDAAAVLDDGEYFRAKYHWYFNEATAENPYQAIRRAQIDIFGAGADGLPIVGPFDVGRQPFTNVRPTGTTTTEAPDPWADSTGTTTTDAPETETPPAEDAPPDAFETETPPAEDAPPDAFEQAREQAEYFDALYEQDLPPEEVWTEEDWAAHDIAEVMSEDVAPLAPTPDRAFGLAIGDVEGGAVFAHGERLMLIGERGHIREIWVPDEFRSDGEVNTPGVEDWLGLEEGDRPSDVPADVAERWEFMGYVTDAAFRTPISEAANERKQRRRRRAKFVMGGMAAAAALGAGVAECGYNPFGDQTDSLIEMQDDAVLREMEVEERALTCLLNGPMFNEDSGECTGGGEPVDAATLCLGLDADFTASSGECDFAGTDDPAAAESVCMNNGATWKADGFVCSFEAGGNTAQGEGADLAAPTTCGPGRVFDDSIGECTETGTAADDTGGGADACAEGGGEWLPDLGICRPSPPPYYAKLGMIPWGPAATDPTGGRSGSDQNPWFVHPSAAMQAYSAWLTGLFADVYGQLLGNTSFPCGANTPDYRVTCPIGAAATEPGEFVVAAMELEGTSDPDGGWLTYGLAFDLPEADNYRGRPPFEFDLFNDTEIWHRYEIDPDGERRAYADGFRDGSPNFPRLSSFRVIDFGDAVVWIIPRDELPDGELAYRLTAFRSAGGPLAAPDPATDGGDVSGFDVDTLDVVPDELVVAELGPGVPPDVDGESLPGPTGGDPDVVITGLLIDDLQTRWNEAFGVGTPEAVADVFHPAATLSSADGCIAFIERIFPQAIEIRLAPTSGPTPIEGFVDYRAAAEVDYPTGTTQFQVQLAVGPGGRLGPIFQCDA